MELSRALADDVLSVLPFGSPCKSIYDIINRVAPSVKGMCGRPFDPWSSKATLM